MRRLHGVAAVLCGLLFAAPGLASAEPLAPMPTNGTWISFARYLPGTQNQNYLYGVGSTVALAPRLSLAARTYFLSSAVPDSPLAFDASAFLSVLQPEYVLGDVYFFGRHECKHDLDQRRRLVILETLGGGWSQNIRGIGVGLEAEATLPAFLPGQTTEAYRASLAAILDADVARLGKAIIFGRARLLGMLMREEMGFSPGFDYQVDVGLRGDPTVVYLRIERQTDSWIDVAVPPTFLVSLTLALTAGVN